jgi:hypothetical protein
MQSLYISRFTFYEFIKIDEFVALFLNPLAKKV